MAYGNGTQFEKTDNMLFFSPRAKDKDGNKLAPHFEIAKLNNAASPAVVEKTGETATEVTGTLVKIKVDERDFKGVKSKHASIYLKDVDQKELYVINTSFRMDSRSLFNGLINLETFEDVQISLYETKKGYSAFSLKQNGKRVDWKYKLEELPEPVAVPFQGKVMRDYSLVDEFFAKELVTLGARVAGNKSEAKSSVPALVGASTNQPVKDEDLPF